MTNEIATQEIKLSVKDQFVENKLSGDRYRIELGNSWLYCMIYKINKDDSFENDEGEREYEKEDNVEILYLDSFYESDIHWKKLMLYAGLIAERLNGNKPFDKIEFNKPM